MPVWSDAPATVLLEGNSRMLRAGHDAWLVVKRRPISELSRAKRWLVRFAYWHTTWSSDYAVEYIGIFTDEEAAKRMASFPGGCVHKLPVNGALPLNRIVQYGQHTFPLSDARARYEARPCEAVELVR